MKFGGTSLEDGPAFDRVARIISSCDGHPVVVASAMSGMTNALLASLETAKTGEIRRALHSLEAHFERHLKVAANLPVNAKTRIRKLLMRSWHDINETLELAASDRMPTLQLADAVASHGERLSANLLTNVLQAYGLPAVYVDARRCIVTADEHAGARPLVKETLRRSRMQLAPLIAAKQIPVIEGFVAATKKGVPSTLGRGSSNYTATLVSAAVGSREVQIWTDVSGVLTANPTLVPSARTIPLLSYAEAAELARVGIRVLHPLMIPPVRERCIPVRILNSRSPEEKGTLICAPQGLTSGSIKSLAHRTNLAKLELCCPPKVLANGFLAAVRKIFGRFETQFEIVGRSNGTISLACDAAAPLPLIAQELRQIGSVEITKDCAVVTCVGQGLRGNGRASESLKRLKEIEPMLGWHSMSEFSLTTTVNTAAVVKVIKRLHEGIFECDQI